MRAIIATTMDKITPKVALSLTAELHSSDSQAHTSCRPPNPER